jgi:deoxyribonuclease-4
MSSPEALLGAHLSTAGGLMKTLERARERGCQCIQIFAGSPRAWKKNPVSQEDADAFRLAAPGAQVRGLVIHASYLVNLASSREAVAQPSVESLRKDLISAGRLGAWSVVVHPGTDQDGQGEARLLQALRTLLPEIPAGCRLLLESMAATNHSLGSLEILGRVCRPFDLRLGVCLDTAHLWAAGYQLDNAKDFKRLDLDIRQQLGYDRIGCLHINDSKYPCGSHRDVHQNLGEGFVGRKGLTRFLRHPPFQGLPCIIETPGFDQKGPDLKNMQRLHAFFKASPKRSAGSLDGEL